MSENPILLTYFRLMITSPQYFLQSFIIYDHFWEIECKIFEFADLCTMEAENNDKTVLRQLLFA